MATTTAPSRAVSRTSAGPEIAIGLAVLGLLSLALIPLEIHQAFGLPAHPLLLHIPVILVPVLGLLLLASARWPAFFERYALAIGALTVVTLASTILTAGAGEAFREDRGGGGGPEAAQLSEHAESGETLRLVMIDRAAGGPAEPVARGHAAGAPGRPGALVSPAHGSARAVRAGRRHGHLLRDPHRSPRREAHLGRRRARRAAARLHAAGGALVAAPAACCPCRT